MSSAVETDLNFERYEVTTFIGVGFIPEVFIALICLVLSRLAFKLRADSIGWEINFFHRALFHFVGGGVSITSPVAMTGGKRKGNYGQYCGDGKKLLHEETVNGKFSCCLNYGAMTPQNSTREPKKVFRSDKMQRLKHLLATV